MRPGISCLIARCAAVLPAHLVGSPQQFRPRRLKTQGRGCSVIDVLRLSLSRTGTVLSARDADEGHSVKAGGDDHKAEYHSSYDIRVLVPISEEQIVRHDQTGVLWLDKVNVGIVSWVQLFQIQILQGFIFLYTPILASI
jgi:hypothetical protein